MISGFDPSEGLPSGWGGGVHTWDVYAEGTIAAGNNGHINVVVGTPPNAGNTPGDPGAVRASTYIQGQVFRPTYAASEGEPCSEIAPWNFWGVGSSNSSALVAQNGDLAKDGSGRIMSCVGGVWRLVGAQISTTFYQIPDCPGCRDGDHQSIDLGLHYLCALTGTFELGSTDPGGKANATRVLPTSDTPNAEGKFDWLLSRGNQGGLGGSAVCLN